MNRRDFLKVAAAAGLVVSPLVAPASADYAITRHTQYEITRDGIQLVAALKGTVKPYDVVYCSASIYCPDWKKMTYRQREEMWQMMEHKAIAYYEGRAL